MIHGKPTVSLPVVRYIYEIPIFSSKYLFQERRNIDQIFLAIPSLTIKETYNLINKISSLSIPILKVPSIDELAHGTVRISDLRPISIEELIGREDISSGIHLSAVEIKRRNPVKGRMHFFSSF